MGVDRGVGRGVPPPGLEEKKAARDTDAAEAVVVTGVMVEGARGVMEGVVVM